MFIRDTTIFILDGFRSAFNVGSVFRTAEAVQPAAVFPCGISARPGGRKVGRTSRGTHALVPWRWFPTALQAARWAEAAGFRLLVVENAPGAVPMHRAELPGRTALVFGSEAGGVSDRVREIGYETVFIPQAGERGCINVSSAAAMAGWEIARRRLTGCSPGS